MNDRFLSQGGWLLVGGYLFETRGTLGEPLVGRPLSPLVRLGGERVSRSPDLAALLPAGNLHELVRDSMCQRAEPGGFALAFGIGCQYGRTLERSARPVVFDLLGELISLHVEPSRRQTRKRVIADAINSPYDEGDWEMGTEGTHMSTITLSQDDVAAAVALVAQIDLSPINAQLRHDDSEMWTEEYVAEIEQKYRRFLVLNLLHPDKTFSVDKALDEYWHQHILDTRKYDDDCRLVFGYFLHHDPYFGLKSDDEWLENVALFSATQELYEEAFGEPYSDKKRLTIDKVVGGYHLPDDGSDPRRVYNFPQSCKCGQHCDKILPAERPTLPDLPREPFEPPAVPFRK